MGNPQRLVERLISGALFGVTRLISGCQVRWIGCGPSSRQRIYFANHSSHLDAMVLWAALPDELRAKTRAVAARDYWQGGAIRRYLSDKIFHNILIDRGEGGATLSAEAKRERAQEAIQTTARSLGEGESLIIFPEGTRHADGELHAFKSGLYYLCQLRPDLELVPVYLENLTRILPKGEFFPLPFLSSASFGAPMQLEAGEAKDAFLLRSREALLLLRPR